jgi:hypothetical protein
MEYLHNISFGVGVLGVLVIVFDVLPGLTRFFRAGVHGKRGNCASKPKNWILSKSGGIR